MKNARNSQIKKTVKSYLTFTHTERMGLLFICTTIVIFITIRLTLHLWVHPSVEAAREQKLVAAWETFKRSQPRAPKDTDEQKPNDYQDAFDENETPLPNTINLNTADSATLVRLKGIGPVTAGRIIAYRNSNGPFTRIDQLEEMHLVPIAVFEILKKHLTVDDQNKN